MPYYIYEHPETKEQKEVFQTMKEDHIYVDQDGVKWNRVFLSCNASIDTRVDPFSEKDFIKATNKKGTFGDLMDRSAEMSETRKNKEGVDPVQEKYYKDYSKKRNGKIHPDQRKSINDVLSKGFQKMK